MRNSRTSLVFDPLPSMNDNQQHQSGTPWDENDSLSRLLGQSRLAEPPAWFAAKTLALCRQKPRTFLETVRDGVLGVWRWGLAGGLAVTMAVALMITHIPAEAPPEQHTVQEAFEVVALLDKDSDSTPSWQDSSM